MADELKDKATADHRNDSLSIYTMVLNRLPIIADTEANCTLISSFILEVMHFMNNCFKLEDSEIGLEINYSVMQQSIIADLVCLQVLLVAALETTGGNSTSGTEAMNTFLKKAKAGSVEVEFGPFDTKNNATLAMGADSYFRMFKKNAINKSAQLGCLIDIDDEASVMFLHDQHIRHPFRIVSCDLYSRSRIIERGE